MNCGLNCDAMLPWFKLKWVQYDGSKDDLDWRIDFRYFDYILFIKKLEIYANKKLLYCLNMLAVLIL